MFSCSQAYEDQKYIKQVIVDQTKLDPKLVEVRCVKIVDKRLKILVLVSVARSCMCSRENTFLTSRFGKSCVFV